MKDVQGKVAYITGGASGMGLAMARSFTAAGMKVVIADIEQSALRTVQAEFDRSNSDVLTLQVDVSDSEAVEQSAVDSIEAFGKIHVLVNNAGVVTSGSISEATLKDWQWVLNVNLIGVINGTHTFLPKIKEHGEGGHIINTASLAGHIAPGTLGVYSTTKFAVVGLSESLRIELEPENIGVSVLCPGVVATNIFWSDRNRPDKLTNPSGQEHSIDSVDNLAEIQQAAMDPALIGDLVLEAMIHDQFYIFSHSEYLEQLKLRHTEIQNAHEFGIDFMTRHQT